MIFHPARGKAFMGELKPNINIVIAANHASDADGPAQNGLESALGLKQPLWRAGRSLLYRAGPREFEL
jgi:hypothetical protein